MSYKETKISCDSCSSPLGDSITEAREKGHWTGAYQIMQISIPNLLCISCFHRLPIQWRTEACLANLDFKYNPLMELKNV